MSLVLAAAMLFTGNFIYAFTPTGCEMECCKEKNSSKSKEILNSDAVFIVNDDNCCDVYIEQAVEQDHAILIITKTINNPNTEAVKMSISEQPEYKQDYTRSLTHKYKTTNIYLSVSNLRI